MASARDENVLLAYRRKTEDVASGFKLFDLLEQDGKITRENFSLLEEMLEAIKRADLAWKVKQFARDDANTAANADVDVPDGGAALKRSTENGHAVVHGKILRQWKQPFQG
ncbi:FAS-associated death domain protein-like [Montipora capricornis]|uniref:FAS-associated death domain protein-like n=1 Tax=Montipora capricornis TaxID=246305 RepID=UPI0035F1EFEA